MSEQASVLGSVPDELKAHAKEMGRLEWGASEPKSAEGHAADMLRSVQLTDEHFGQSGEHQMHGCYLDKTNVVVCHVGTSPNSPNNAKIIVGLWNWLLDEIEREEAARSAS